jgi:aminoglycoside phosphotransferase (APT) family kinase protein
VASPDRERLLRFLREQLPAARDLAVSDLVAGAQGLSREHFAFDLRWTEAGEVHEEALILIRDGERPGQTDRGNEFRLLRALERSPIRAPRAFWCDTNGRWLERPFLVMERVAGDVTPSIEQAYADAPALRERLASRLSDGLVALHRLDWRRLGLEFLAPDCAPEAYATHRVGELEALVPWLKPPEVVERAVARCREHAPRTPHLVLCHGDYKLDNVLHREGRVLALIDWERAHLGDPLEDLAYATLPYLVRTGQAAGLPDPDTFLRRYREQTELSIDAGALAFWQRVHHLLYFCYFRLLIESARARDADEARRVEAFLEPPLGLLREEIETPLARSEA